MARALIVGCGCRGRELGRALIADGWQVRGTSREPERLAPIEGEGIEAALADPDRVGTLLEPIEDVAVVFWLLGSAQGDQAELSALCGPRLERLLEEIVDTPVRGFVYEAAGTVPAALRQAGAAVVRAASKRWRIPVELIDADPFTPERWCGSMLNGARRLTGQARYCP